MASLTIDRMLDAPPEKVFEFISKTEHILKWWGPEGMTHPEHELIFDKKGPWYSVMQNAEGHRYKVSGQVTHIDPPNSIGFTWAWHDETDKRGVESHVTIRLVPEVGGRTKLTLSHIDLPAESAESHEHGWNSTLNKLERLFNA